MVFYLSLCVKFALCLALIIQLASQNHHENAIQIEILLIASSALLLWGRFFRHCNQRKFGLQTAFPVLIPLAIYFVCNYFINSLGGLGGCSI